MDSKQPNQQLWLALVQGDRQAMAQIYDRHGGLVYGIALKVLGSPQEAEDLTQDIFLKLAETGYDPQRGSLRTYLAMLTRSRAIDRVRSRHTAQRAGQRLQRRQPTGATPTPISEALQQEQDQQVRAALAQLSDSQQQILKMAYYDGMTQAKIAERLDKPLGTVKTQARRGLLRLRQILQPRLNS